MSHAILKKGLLPWPLAPITMNTPLYEIMFNLIK